MQFDARQAKLLPAGSHIVIEDCPGLRLTASASRKSWIYRYKSPVDDRMRQKKIGVWPAMSFITAVGHWQQLKEQRDAGQDPALVKKSEKRERKAAVTVAAVVKAYLEQHIDVHREANGAAAIRSRLTQAIAGMETTPAAEITRKEAFDLLAGMQNTPVKAQSVRRELGAAWEHAIDAGLLVEEVPNWWRQVMSRKLKSKGAMRAGERKGVAKRSLSDRELSILLQSDIHLFSQAVQDVLTLYLWTCCRGAEIVAMHRKHITKEQDGTWWTVPKALTKNARHERATDLRVPLIGRALQVVERRLETHEGYLFPSTRGAKNHTTQAAIQSQVHFRQPYCVSRKDVQRQRLAVTHWSPHDLRRTGRTKLSALKCPPDVAETILGHLLPGVEGTYNLYDFDVERRQWLTAWSSYLEGLALASLEGLPARP